jgi:hypothetical protein
MNNLFLLSRQQKVLRPLGLKFFKRLLPLCFCLVLFYLFTGCNKDSGSQQRENNQVNCVVSLSFEMETTTTARPVNKTDQQNLAPIDNIMALPHRERYAIEACYRSENERHFTMTLLTPTNPINYPANTADGYIKPDYKRMEVSAGVARYYDHSNNLIRTGNLDGNAAAVQKILEQVANKKVLTTAEFTQGLNIMRDSGMLVQHHENNLASIRLNNPDGSHCIQVLDKERQVAVGNFYYDGSGVLQSRSMLNFEGTAQQPILKNVFTEARYTSLENNIPMWVQRYASIDDFSINFQ